VGAGVDARGTARPSVRRSDGSSTPSAEIEEIYRELAPPLLGYFRSHGSAAPEDLVATFFSQVVRDLPRFRGDAAARRRWIFTIAHNRLVDEYRRRSRRPELLFADLPDRVDSRTDVTGIEHGIDSDLVRALGGLTPLQRQVVVLRFVADLPIEDVARIVKRSRGAVKSLQNRALGRLAELLASSSDGG
jgi:RNA polymerase sigma factor (sigma-70 family)